MPEQDFRDAKRKLDELIRANAAKQAGNASLLNVWAAHLQRCVNAFYGDIAGGAQAYCTDDALIVDCGIRPSARVMSGEREVLSGPKLYVVAKADGQLYMTQRSYWQKRGMDAESRLEPVGSLTIEVLERRVLDFLVAGELAFSQMD